jgi:hypothetical protein
MVKSITILVAVAILAVGGYLGYGALHGVQKDVARPTGTIDVARDAAAKSDLLLIRTGIQSYMAMNGQLPASADQGTLGSLVDPWPTNPWTQAPMKSGSATGDFAYAPGSGASFSLTVHLSGDKTSAAP